MATATPARVRHLSQGHDHRPGGGHGGRRRHLRPLLGLRPGPTGGRRKRERLGGLLRRMKEGTL